jgi:cation:H+ antiporter
MLLLALVVGIAVLVKSADAFVTGAASVAGHFGMPPLLIGMIVVGFGTSMPELVVSVMSATEGAAGIALGNAWGSNIANIALILGVAALVKPVTVHSRVLRREIPVLALITVMAGAQVLDLRVGRVDGILLLTVFALLLGWSFRQQRRRAGDPLGTQSAQRAEVARPRGMIRSTLELSLGLAFLIAASRAVVWGAMGIARAFGVSDLLIGLTVVAVGTSLPELASSVAAARRGRDEIAFGNVVGSNLFNTLAVVGLAAVISPFHVSYLTRVRDLSVMLGLTLLLSVLGVARSGGTGRVSRAEGVLLLLVYGAYVTALAITA